MSEVDIIDRFNEYSQVLAIKSGSGSGMLEEFAQHHGLLVECANGIYSFSHLTFQEFFTALHLCKGQPTEVIENLCKEVSREPRWREVVIFLGGLLPRADMLLTILRNHMKKALKTPGKANSLLGIHLPEPAKRYIEQRQRGGEDRMVWEAWFRCRLFETAMIDYAYRQSQHTLQTQISLQRPTLLIVQIANLGKHVGGDLSRDRKLKMVLKECDEEGYKGRSSGTDIAKYGEAYICFYRLAGIILEILASRARVTPSLKTKILDDMFRPTIMEWDYPTFEGRNKLGA